MSLRFNNTVSFVDLFLIFYFTQNIGSYPIAISKFFKEYKFLIDNSIFLYFKANFIEKIYSFYVLGNILLVFLSL
jgi:hypothetical protein